MISWSGYAPTRVPTHLPSLCETFHRLKCVFVVARSMKSETHTSRSRHLGEESAGADTTLESWQCNQAPPSCVVASNTVR